MPEIKTERGPSPGPPPLTARRRPQKLDLDTNPGAMPSGRPSAPLTAKDSGGLSSMQEVATACLSPGVDTSNPRVREQMERSKEMADQQRAIIASRQMKSGGKGAESSGSKPAGDLGPPPPATSGFSKPNAGPIRKKPPPSSLALGGGGGYPGEPRVIQSAPLNQTFTGLNRQPHPLSRQVLEHSHQQGYGLHNPRQPSQPYSPTASTPQSTRLPPIADVFANERLGPGRPNHTLNRSNSGPGSANQASREQPLYAPITNSIESRPAPPLSSSGVASPARPAPYADSISHQDYPPPPSSHESFMRSTAASHPQPRPAQEDREYRSAEEAIHSMAGGREELLPKVVHYGGHQPPTPPSPLGPMGHHSHSDPRYGHQPNNLKTEAAERNERRRTREEFERDHEHAGADEAERERERERRRVDGPIGGVPGLGFGFGTLRNDGSSRHSPETLRRKKEEFIGLCARAWDLLHE